jgi:hypothetical protein
LADAGAIPAAAPPLQVATAAGFIYWGDADGLHRCPGIGCAAKTPPVLRADADMSFLGAPIAAEDKLLLFAPQRAAAGPVEIRRCAANACTSAQSIYQAESGSEILRIETDGVYAAFIEGSFLRACVVERCQATAVTISTAVDSQNLMGNASSKIARRVFALKDGQLAYSRGNKIFACTLPNCTPVDMFDGPSSALTFFGGALYASVGEPEALVHCKMPGCDRKPEPDGVVLGPVVTGLYVSTRFVAFASNGGMAKVAR